MKLTNSMRNAFVHAAMNDVPQVDYDVQARKLVTAAAAKLFASTFPGVDYEKLKAAGWLNEAWFSTPRYLSNVCVPAPSNQSIRSSELEAQLQELANAAKAQSDQRDELEQKLRAVAYSVTTREALVKALPEFEKYLPSAPDAVAKNLPAVANLVADFTRAGWPKDKQNDTAQGTAAATGT